MSVKANNYLTGKLGEKLATMYLQAKGYKIIQTNYRSNRLCELDIVATNKEDIYVFVEVKTRFNDLKNISFNGYDEINKLKIKKLIYGINSYLANMTDNSQPSARLDVIVIYINKSDFEALKIKYANSSVSDFLVAVNKIATINHLENISIDLI